MGEIALDHHHIACDDSRALSLKDVLREGLPGGR